MAFRVPSSGNYNLKVRMGGFGVGTRNSNSQNKVTEIRCLPSEFWGSSKDKPSFMDTGI